MQRLVYAPEVIAYIKSDKETINISNDIISGSVTRRTDAPSNASLVLQNRNLFYNGRFRPMDRIIIYLKKTKPILVFSGYLDSVPELQIVPGPVTINASCTLKLLEFTYFDPGLPTVQTMMAKYVGAGEDFAAIPQLGGGNPFAFVDTRNRGQGGGVEEIGFGRMLAFLVSEVGNWPKDSVHILPIPDGWIEMAAELMNRIQLNEKSTSDTEKEVLKALLTHRGNTGGTAGSADSGAGIALSGSEEEVAAKIDAVIQRRRPEAPLNGFGRIFVRQGVDNGVVPQFMAAICGAESSFGTDSSAQAAFNPFGDLEEGPGSPLIKMNSWEDGIAHLAKKIKTEYFSEGRTDIESFWDKWCVPSDIHWKPNVTTFMREMGADPGASLVLTSIAPSSSELPREREVESSAGTTVKFYPYTIANPSGTGESWEGSRGPIEYLYSFVERLGNYRRIRDKQSTRGKTNGCNYDHDNSTKNAYAIDIGYPNEKAGEKAATLLFDLLSQVATPESNGPTGPGPWGKIGGAVVFNVGQLRWKLVFKTGVTKNHIHLSVQRHTNGRFGLPANIDRDKVFDLVIPADQALNPNRPSVPSTNTGGGPSGVSRTGGGGSGGGPYTVVIEAGHSPPLNPGFEGGGNPDEARQNETLKAKIEQKLGANPNIKVVPLSGSDLTQLSGSPDVFVSIHHNATTATCVDHPDTGSKNVNGEGLPNIGGATGTSTNVSPPRKNIHQNSQLIADSKKLAQSISSQTNIPVRSLSISTYNYYGFYFSNAKACVIIEVDKTGATYDVDAKANQITNGIESFLQAGGPAGGGNDGTNQFVQACVKYAEENAASGYTKHPYQLGGYRSGAMKDKPDGQPVDCSGFFMAVAKDFGISDPAFGTTVTMDEHGTSVPYDPDNLAAGTFLVRGTSGGAAHMVMYIGDGQVVESSTVGSKDGVQLNTLAARTDSRGWRAYTVAAIGTGSAGPSGAPEGNTGPQFQTSQALNAVFNFPGDPLESLILQGSRALENDVKLLQVVADVAKASMRTFASHPNGDFMAWFPDYFNSSGKTPYLNISENEIIDCTINLSDKNLATHVFVNGDFWGGNVLGTDAGTSNPMIRRLLGQWGVVNIEQAWLLDTFLTSSRTKKDRKSLLTAIQDVGELITDVAETVSASTNQTKKNNKNQKNTPRLDLLGQPGPDAFLARYGARPYAISNPILRHPYMNFFIAYQTFQLKWAEQFESQVEFTFMPELFPGTFVRMADLGVNFYCSEVTHNFDYQGGFTTTANLMAPSSHGEDAYNFGMALAQKPYRELKYDDSIGILATPKPETKRQNTPLQNATNRRNSVARAVSQAKGNKKGDT